MNLEQRVRPPLLDICGNALDAVQAYYALVRQKLSATLAPGGKWDNALATQYQHEAHGMAWLATYASALGALLDWAKSLREEGQFGELEQLILGAAFGEYLNQIAGGIPMTQVEVSRPIDFGLQDKAEEIFSAPACMTLRREGYDRDARARIAVLIRHGQFGALHHGDETLDQIADNLRRFVANRVTPNAHGWHCRNEYIPMPIIEEMSELGIFGLTVPEEWGGSGLGKLAMCIASEELSRGYIGVGSLGTRAEIAAELIRLGGTEAQKQTYLPRIASGELLPTAVFTEPNTGSDLASLKTRAVREGDVYKVYGNKTWITHPVRADLMTLLVRTNPKEPGHRGLSMLLAEKPRGDDANPFPAKGMTGTEIEVLGYRGMKEYEIAFDGFEVKAENLLGGVEGLGFKQLMQTFESARIQTAARAIGVAQAAMEQAIEYGKNRVQFGKPIIGFPRVADKIVMMAVEIMIARQLTYHAAREKDSGRRCDLEAGMAKLFGARVAWAAADNAVQVHGGNGFALEFPVSRILCDARILNIFEGAAEIQAQVIARRLLDGTN